MHVQKGMRNLKDVRKKEAQKIQNQTVLCQEQIMDIHQRILVSLINNFNGNILKTSLKWPAKCGQNFVQNCANT